jgi:hypothetical protein
MVQPLAMRRWPWIISSRRSWGRLASLGLRPAALSLVLLPSLSMLTPQPRVAKFSERKVPTEL